MSNRFVGWDQATGGPEYRVRGSNVDDARERQAGCFKDFTGFRLGTLPVADRACMATSKMFVREGLSPGAMTPSMTSTLPASLVTSGVGHTIRECR